MLVLMFTLSQQNNQYIITIQRMGNKSSSLKNLDSFNPIQWQQIPANGEQKPQYGKYQVLRHNITNQEIDRYEITFNDQEEYNFYMESYSWRMQEEHIVNTLYLREKHIRNICSTTYIVDVYIQHIPVRLSDVTDIPFPENLYVFNSLIQGYSQLYYHLGYFNIKENQICVDADGFVKVWINSDLSKNYSDSDDIVQTQERMTQSSMVNEIITLVSENTDHQAQAMPLNEYFKLRNKLHPTFEDAKILLNQYSIQYETPIPDCFQSILQMINKRERNQSFSNNDGQINTVQRKPSELIESQIIKVDKAPVGYSSNAILNKNQKTLFGNQQDRLHSFYQEKIPENPNSYRHPEFGISKIGQNNNKGQTSPSKVTNNIVFKTNNFTNPPNNQQVYLPNYQSNLQKPPGNLYLPLNQHTFQNGLVRPTTDRVFINNNSNIRITFSNANGPNIFIKSPLLESHNKLTPQKYLQRPRSISNRTGFYYGQQNNFQKQRPVFQRYQNNFHSPGKNEGQFSHYSHIPPLYRVPVDYRNIRPSLNNNSVTDRQYPLHKSPKNNVVLNNNNIVPSSSINEEHFAQSQQIVNQPKYQNKKKDLDANSKFANIPTIKFSNTIQSDSNMYSLVQENKFPNLSINKRKQQLNGRAQWTYYTNNSEEEIDPEIVADLLIFEKEHEI